MFNQFVKLQDVNLSMVALMVNTSVSRFLIYCGNIPGPRVYMCGLPKYSVKSTLSICQMDVDNCFSLPHSNFFFSLNVHPYLWICSHPFEIWDQPRFCQLVPYMLLTSCWHSFRYWEYRKQNRQKFSFLRSVHSHEGERKWARYRIKKYTRWRRDNSKNNRFSMFINCLCVD